jgi:RNA recognition motif-containing protein
MAINKVYIGNLSFRSEVKDIIEQLEDLFSEFGEIEDISVIEDRKTGRIKGYGFITFEDSESVNKALKLNGEMLLGRPMRVSLAKESEVGATEGE